MKTRSEHSAGAVVVRGEGSEPEVVLASRRTRRGRLAWGLPKGIVEADEDPSETALREVREETGLNGDIEEPLGDITYWFVWDGERVSKKVTFYLMRATGGDVSLHDHEMEEVRWFPLAEAVRIASYSGERDVLRRAAKAMSVPL